MRGVFERIRRKMKCVMRFEEVYGIVGLEDGGGIVEDDVEDLMDGDEELWEVVDDGKGFGRREEYCVVNVEDMFDVERVRMLMGVKGMFVERVGDGWGGRWGEGCGDEVMDRVIGREVNIEDGVGVVDDM